jgi:hypothetical protein
LRDALLRSLSRPPQSPRPLFCKRSAPAPRAGEGDLEARSDLSDFPIIEKEKVHLLLEVQDDRLAFSVVKA